MNTIRLTTTDNVIVYLNIDAIESIERAAKGGALVRVPSGYVWHIADSADEIAQKIGHVR